MTETHRKLMLANADKYCFDDLSVLFMLHLAPACATIAFFWKESIIIFNGSVLHGAVFLCGYWLHL